MDKKKLEVIEDMGEVARLLSHLNKAKQGQPRIIGFTNGIGIELGEADGTDDATPMLLMRSVIMRAVDDQISWFEGRLEALKRELVE